MRNSQHIARISICTAFVLICCFAIAQEEKDRPLDGRTDEPADSAASVEQVKTTILFVRNDKGELLPVPDLTLDELARLKKLQNAAARPEESPKFHFVESTVSGTTNEGQATLKVVLDIVVHETGWNRVPLELGDAVIVNSVFEGEGKQFLQYDDDEGGYFAWIQPLEPDSTHRVTMNVRAKTIDTGNGRRLDLKLPKVVGARDAPNMTLRVPIENAAGFANAGSQVCPVEAKSIGKATEFRIVQPGGDFSLTWRSTRSNATKTKPVVFDARSKIIVGWDSQSQITWEATIALNVLQGQLASMTVELPEGARVANEEYPGQRIVVNEPASSSESGSSSSVEIVLDRVIPQGASGEVRLKCERQLDPREIGVKAEAEIAGFNVQNAARQSGYVGFVFSDQWRASLGSTAKIFRQYEMPSGFRDAGVTGSNTFQFLSQPFSLPMSVSPRERRVGTTASHILDVSPRQLSLVSNLRYSVVGRHLDVCSVIFPGWEIESIQLVEGDTVEAVPFDPPTESRLDVDLPREMRGEFELRVLAVQQLPTDAEFFVVNLPTLDEEQAKSPELFVIADDDIEVRCDLDRSPGLSRGGEVSELPLPQREYPPQVYRIDKNATASFAAEIVTRPQEITVQSHATVNVTRSTIAMTQLLTYNVRHEAASSLELDVPDWWSSSPRIQVTVDGEPANVSIAPIEMDNGISRMIVNLAQARLDSIGLTLRYEISMSELVPNEATNSTAYFARPADAEISVPFSVTIDAPESIDVRYAGGAFEELQESGDNLNALRLTSSQLQRHCDFTLTYLEADEPYSTVVERAWLQTWLTKSGRQDRAVFQILTNRPRIELALPTSASAERWIVVVDGKALAITPDADGLMVLPLERMEVVEDGARQLRSHVIEVGWSQNRSTAIGSSVLFAMPKVADSWSQHVRWHIVAPRNLLILTAPRGMAGDLMGPLAWWRRDSSSLQRECELWVGATAQPSPETIGQAGAVRQYTFSTIGESNGASAQCVSVSFALFAVGGLLLATGMAFLHVRRLRHPGVAIASSVVLVCLIFARPAAALVGGQAVVVILVVILISRLIRILLGRLKRRPANSRRAASPSSVIRVRPSTRIGTEAQLAGTPSTTANAGASLPVGTSDLQ